MIEIAPEEYWKRSTIHNIDLYLFVLKIDGKIGWRLPTLDEYLGTSVMGWYLDDRCRFSGELHPITPVRDLKDD